MALAVSLAAARGVHTGTMRDIEALLDGFVSGYELVAADMQR
jgi:hypothetical protein